MNKKNFPLVLMLAAGAVTCIITYIQKFSILKKVTLLFFVLLLFYILGSILVWTLNYFEEQNEKKQREEGMVIEKEAEEAGVESGSEMGSLR
ncbi:MAG: hypothetical protein ACI4HQ_01935 [Acetatifactor sp.]